MDLSRRDWLTASLSLVSLPEILAAQEHAHNMVRSGAPAKFVFFDPKGAAEIAAIAERIIPTDDTPGAREAGVIYFIDRALTTFDEGKQHAYRDGLAEVQTQRLKLFPQSENIAKLTAAQQDELLRSIEQTDFFQMVRSHTIMGFLGNPSYGGNRNGVGWKLIGFEDSMKFEPPFGYYDREAAKEGGR